MQTVKCLKASIIILLTAVTAVADIGYRPAPEITAKHNQWINHMRGEKYFKESVIKAFAAVPREYFVPAGKQNRAYENINIPIGYGQAITRPELVAYMTNKLEIQASDKVLEIGSGSGYQASILYQITKNVYSIEIVDPLAALAAKRWKDLGYTGIKGKTADGYFGWAEHSPFDKIIVTCAADHVPTFLLQQLKKGGTMIIPVGNPFDRQTLLLLTKRPDGVILTQRLHTVKFVPFTGKMLEKRKK
jgi:protein-L-isoaspartate(D-aspartate) O-methyltransferase